MGKGALGAVSTRKKHYLCCIMKKPSANNNAWFGQILEAWYDVHRRSLPWRETNDPYLIWLSEIILQQTRIEQGTAYYLRFAKRFPTVESLAAASEDDVLKMWEGLGYYSRARHLHQAARIIAQKGKFPNTYETLKQLPGVGNYTAAAVASMAFGLPHAVVDGNVFRVITRVFCIEEPIDEAAGKRLVEQLAHHLLDTQRPALYNQAIMDFGALWCKPQSPRCADCPLQNHCLGRAAGKIGALPAKRAKKNLKDRWFAYIFVIDQEQHIYIKRRGAGDIWQGLYEPWLVEMSEPFDEAQLLSHPTFQAVACRGNASLTFLQPETIHLLTHQRLHLFFYVLSLNHPHMPRGYKRIPISEAKEYAFPIVVKQAFSMLKTKK